MIYSIVYEGREREREREIAAKKKYVAFISCDQF